MEHKFYLGRMTDTSFEFLKSIVTNEVTNDHEEAFDFKDAHSASLFRDEFNANGGTWFVVQLSEDPDYYWIS